VQLILFQIKNNFIPI